MKTLATILAVLCSIAFVLAAPAAIVGFNAESKMLNSATYKTVFARAGVYDTFIDALAQDLRRRDAASGQGVYAGLNDADLRSFVGALFPTSAVQPVVEQGIDQSVALFRGEIPSVSVSLTPFKTGLAQRLLATSEAIVANKPLCDMTGPPPPLLSCKPPPQYYEGFRRALGDSAVNTLAAMPDFWVSPATPEETAQMERSWPLATRQLTVNVLRFAPLVPIAFLALVALLVVRSPRDAMRWFGLPMLIAGAVSLALWALAQSIFAAALEQARLQSSSVETPGAAFSFQLVDLVGQEFLNAVMLHAAILGGVGLLLLILSAMTPKTPSRAQNQAWPNADPNRPA